MNHEQSPHNLNHSSTPKQIIENAVHSKRSENTEKQNPQIISPSSQSLNNFMAIKKLRETEEHIKMIKGRFKVLKIKQQSFRAKTIYHQNIIKFNEEADKFKSQHKAQILRAYRQREQQKNENKQKNLKLRDQIRQKNKQVREEMLNEKIEENKKIKQQSLENDKKYKEIKLQDKEIKIQKRNKILEEQKQQKHRVDRYKESRVNETKQHKTLDMNSIIQKNNAKQKQLQELMKMQQQMEKQHGNSVQASRLLKVRLQSVINRRKDTNSHHSRLSGSTNLASTLQTKLPEINNRSSITMEQKTIDSTN